MRWTMLLATAALALPLPFILAHCASVPGPLTYDAKSVGKPNSGAPMELWLPPGTGPFPAVVVIHGCGGITRPPSRMGRASDGVGLRRGPS